MAVVGMSAESYAAGPAKNKSAKGAKTSNTFAAPDFAFPQTVEKNAAAEFGKAMASGDGLTALRAAIQLDVATGLVSADTYAASLARFDSVARVMPAPYGSLARLLEARLYCDIYNSQSWKFDNRTLPPSPVPDNVLEWSTPMFSSAVTRLVSEAMAGAGEAASMPLSKIDLLLSDAADAERAGFSVQDFMTLKAINALGTFGSARRSAELPFGRQARQAQTPAGMAMSLVDDAIARHSGDSDRFIMSYFCNARLGLLAGSERAGYLKKCVDMFIDTPYCANFLAQYYSEQPVEEAGNADAQNVAARKRFEALNAYLAKFPSAPGIGEIESMINDMKSRSVTVSFQEQMLPGRVNGAKVSGSNVYDFHVLVFAMKRLSGGRDYKYSDIHTGARLVAAIPVKVSGTTPDRFETPIEIPALTPGVYAFVASSTADKSGILQKSGKSYLPVATVSNLAVIKTECRESKGRQMYVVSGINQQPVAGAKVSFYPVKNGVKGAPVLRNADSNGCVAVPDGELEYIVEADGSRLDGNYYRKSVSTRDDKTNLRGSVFTDLSIYRPGDKVQFQVVAYTQRGNDLRAAAGRRLSISLRDANWQQVDTLSVETDRLGRADASFTLPKSGLLGNWSVTVNEGNAWVCNTFMQVAEYKSPTFMVTMDSAAGSYKAGETLRFGGKAVTYSGMPVAGGKVAYTVEYVPMWWRRSVGGASYGGETETGADGKFMIELPTDGLEGTDYARGSYRLKVTVTDAAGESREAQSLRFALGNELHIAAALPEMIEADKDEPAYDVTVNDMTGHPVVKKVYYDISADGASVASGEFDSPAFRPDLSVLRSGRYAFRFSLTPDFKSDAAEVVTDSVTIWRADDKRPPVSTPLWVPVKQIVVPAGEKKVSLRVGSSYDDSWIFAQVADSRHVIRDEWVRVSDGIVSVDIDAPADDERVYVTLLGTRDLNKVSETVTVTPYAQTVRLDIKAETFRDRIEPGARETWKFRFTTDGKAAAGIADMAVMSNKALNALAPFQWAFNPYGSLYWNNSGRVSFKSIYPSSCVYSSPATGNVTRTKTFLTPEWNTYGYMLYQSGVRVVNEMKYMSAGVKVRGRMAKSNDSGADAAPEEILATVQTTSKKLDSAEMEEAADEAAPAGGSTPAADSEPLREVEYPLAFFMPGLTTDGEGVSTLEFTAPNFVGTWQLQVMGYTPEMRGGVLTLDAVSAKKVMAQLNAPRFVRTGDRLSVSATIYNNTGSAEKVSGRIEFFDPMNGQTIYAYGAPSEEVAASGSRVVTAEMSVPSDIDALGIRVYGEIPGHTDGEQTIIPVLPSSTPVIESTPFYIAPSARDFSVRLPKFGKGSKVTLTYSDNPVWECVTALPSLTRPESVNMLSQAEALYGNAVASGLFARYPQLIEGIKEMASPVNAADSSLYSPLQKNAALKTVLLNNTPWVNGARAETARMQRLTEYADTASARAAVAAIMKTLTERQNGDGGWSWCPEMKSSEFITMRVLGTFASLANMGYLPEGAEKLARKAFRYVDGELAKDWNRSDRKYVPVSTLLEYLYDKSAFKGIGATSAFKPLEAAAIKKITANWRDFDIKDKATAAMLMERRGDAKLARLILESLRQFASVSAEKGMWYDNLRSGYDGMGTLLTTARVLEAYAMIEPQSESVDLLRQWFVVTKQTQNWGDRTASAEAIQAVLSSGSEWTAPAAAPVITLGGKQVDTGRVSSVTGSFTVDLDAASASGRELRVSRSGQGPAWGGVLSQYIAPITEVKAASIPQLSIAKSVYTITPGEAGNKATDGDLKTGDRVRVTLTITCDRDLEYVAVTDPRAACLEPADQISSYTQSDGVWFYREVRDAATNLFIPFLSKGTHVISYDCFTDRAGEYSLGVANAQSQYAPTITAHSAGTLLRVE